jgi:hypothetical protein
VGGGIIFTDTRNTVIWLALYNILIDLPLPHIIQIIRLKDEQDMWNAWDRG